MHLKFSFFVSVLASALVVTGCGSGSGGGVADEVQPTTGRVSINITDAPVDAAHKACLVFDSAEFKHADDTVDNQLVEFQPPVALDLLALQGTNSAPLLVGAEMPAGHYNWIRLSVIAGRGLPTIQDADPLGSNCVTEGSYIVLADGMVHNLYIPGGDEAGLRLNRGFELPAGGSADFTIDFDLRKSIGAPPGQAPDYRLRPTMRLVDNAMAGMLTGMVDASLATAADCVPVVYVYSGDVTPDDMDGDEGDPLTSAMVESDDGGITWVYTVGFLPAGAYTAAFTCDADDAEADEVLAFVPADGVDFTVAVDEVAEVDFPPQP
ncbi:MAG: DUF4382 domain-containing protein [Gammaproteobacteria bacterium]|nr:DUF4382 domain-containing protein [Gammaproteobacteria bacterium]